MCHIKIITLFVCAYVKSSYNDLFACHRLSNLSVNHELFFFRREILALKVYELTSEKPDSASIILNNFGKIFYIAYISIKHKLLSIGSNIIFTFKSL